MAFDSFPFHIWPYSVTSVAYKTEWGDPLALLYMTTQTPLLTDLEFWNPLVAKIHSMQLNPWGFMQMWGKQIPTPSPAGPSYWAPSTLGKRILPSNCGSSLSAQVMSKEWVFRGRLLLLWCLRLLPWEHWSNGILARSAYPTCWNISKSQQLDTPYARLWLPPTDTKEAFKGYNFNTSMFSFPSSVFGTLITNLELHGRSLIFALFFLKS